MPVRPNKTLNSPFSIPSTGEAISSVLDFLSKELARLDDERRCHALSLLAETQRDLREAKESGRRQRVAERRREFNEMFKQVTILLMGTTSSHDAVV